MWCRHCQQDVPAVVSPRADSTPLRCPRCGGEMAAANAADLTGVAAGADSGEPPDVPDFEDWELSQELRQIERILRVPELRRAERNKEDEAAYRREAMRLDRQHAAQTAWPPPPRPQPQAPRPAARPRQPSFFGWLCVALGTTALVCGGVLCGWAWLGHRPGLWSIGLPTAIGGQVALVLGLVLQLRRLWHDSRRAAEQLDCVEGQLTHLQANAAMLAQTQGALPNQAFYTHLAHGAGPDLLLHDLKSQLDLLAMQIQQQGR
jgi:hypothetical protein